MKTRILSLILILSLIMTVLAGCGENPVAKKVITTKQERKPQLVVAMNPIIISGGTTNIIAFNDVKNAISTDKKSATLTSLTDNTSWIWAYKMGEDWKKRGIYGLDKWRNGDHISADNLSAYSFTSDGTISLMPYTLKAAKLTTYQGETPENAGVLLSVAGTEEETLCYQIGESGTFSMPTGKITAIESVGGVKTGFLAEDGTERSAVVKFIINTREVWSGEFCNSTAGNGTAVTELTYPDVVNVDVEAGDKFFISVKLDAKANKQEDIGKTNTPKKDKTSSDNKPSDESGTKKEEPPVEIPFVDGYTSQFKIVYPKGATVTEKQIMSKFKKSLVELFDVDVIYKDDSIASSDYELLIGLTNRPESKRAYSDLTDYRANNGSDFIIRMDNKKLVIAANTDYSLQLAVDYFMKNICKTDKDTIMSNFSYAYRPQMESITVGGSNIAAYTIRTEKYPSVMTVRAAKALAEYVVKRTGYNLKIAKDTETTANEILVGLTTRSGISSETFKSASLDFQKGINGNTYNGDDYKVFVYGTKLFLEAGSDYAASLAVSELMKQLDKSSDFAANMSLDGSYKKGEYTLLDDFAYTWGDEFYTSSGSSFSKKNWKAMEKGYTEKKGPWYEKTDPYYLASKASLSDGDPSNDFGGPWLETTNSKYVQEGTCKNLVSNVRIQDNLLIQTSKRETSGYSGSTLCTDGRMEFRYGILEARMINATANGNASCFWTRTKDGGSVVNEIDMVENFGADHFRPNLHTWPNGGTHVDHGSMISLRKEVYPQENEHLYDTFHHIAVEWTPEFINMYMDGEIYLSQEITSDTWYAFKETTYVIVSSNAPSDTYANAGNPGNWLTGGGLSKDEAARLFDTNGDGKVDISDFCEEQKIDYMRLYQINSRQYSLKAKK